MEAKRNTNKIFEVSFRKHTTKELISFLDDWLDEIKNLEQMKIAVRMTLRIMEFKMIDKIENPNLKGEDKK